MFYWLQILKKSNLLGIIIILSILITTMGLLSPIFIIHIFNRYITFGLEGTLYFLVFGAILVASFEFFFRNLRNEILDQIIQKPIKQTKFESFNISFEKNNISKEKILEILDINNNNQKFLSSQNQSNLIDSFFLIFILIFLFFLNFKLSIIFILILLSYLLIQKYRNLKKLRINEANKILEIDRQILRDLINNYNLLNYLCANKYINFFLEKFNNKKQLNDSSVSLLESVNSTYNNFTILISSIIVIGVGATFVVNGEMTIGALIGFNIFSSRAIVVASSAQRSYFNLTLINNYIVKLNKILDKSKKDFEKLQLSKITGYLELKNVDFSFEDSNFYLLKNISLKVVPGTIVNISGNNGSGKTTLAKLILGLHPSKNGEILIDDTNILKLSPGWLKKQIAYIPQDPEILGSSIVDNILLANENLNQEEISRLLQTVGLDEMLKKANLSFTELVNTEISKGLKKKVHYARLLAMKSQIYLLDDPLGCLDSKGVEMVLKLIQSFKKSQKTILTFSDDNLINEISDNIIKL